MRSCRLEFAGFKKGQRLSESHNLENGPKARTRQSDSWSNRIRPHEQSPLFFYFVKAILFQALTAGEKYLVHIKRLSCALPFIFKNFFSFFNTQFDSFPISSCYIVLF